jgi:membrane-associated protease RseP (regulator of RpoE activity)
MSDPIPSLAYPLADDSRPAVEWIPRPPGQIYWLHSLLLLLTCLTTLVVGANLERNFLLGRPAFSFDDNSPLLFQWQWIFDHPSRLKYGVPFAGTLMLILLAHEMGHYLYCKRYRVWATLPFFIPAPVLSPFGTLGAFIRIRAPIRSRTALFDIGIAGPIAGFLVSVGALWASLGRSKPVLPGIQPGLLDHQLGFPLIFQLMRRLLAWQSGAHSVAALPLKHVLLHPCAIAAWVGMLVTSLNLLPVGQLDGGHIVFSIAPRAHKFLSRLTILILLPMGFFLGVGWFFWGVVLAILMLSNSFRHPQVAELPRVSGARVWLALFAVAMLVLTLTPAPFEHTSVPEVYRELRGQ